MTKLGVHGTRYTYDKGKCRCTECAEANRCYIREYYQRDYVREASRLRQRQYYQRRRAATTLTT